eukprot:m.133056 g.133056  ORF g.133056 m.133056 type:complete len:1351 (-) comp13941_c0_seq1:351-4403(-)
MATPSLTADQTDYPIDLPPLSLSETLNEVFDDGAIRTDLIGLEQQQAINYLSPPLTDSELDLGDLTFLPQFLAASDPGSPLSQEQPKQSPSASATLTMTTPPQSPQSTTKNDALQAFVDECLARDQRLICTCIKTFGAAPCDRTFARLPKSMDDTAQVEKWLEAKIPPEAHRSVPRMKKDVLDFNSDDSSGHRRGKIQAALCLKQELGHDFPISFALNQRTGKCLATCDEGMTTNTCIWKVKGRDERCCIRPSHASIVPQSTFAPSITAEYRELGAHIPNQTVRWDELKPALSAWWTANRRPATQDAKGKAADKIFHELSKALKEQKKRRNSHRVVHQPLQATPNLPPQLTPSTIPVSFSTSHLLPSAATGFSPAFSAPAPQHTAATPTTAATPVWSNGSQQTHSSSGHQFPLQQLYTPMHGTGSAQSLTMPQMLHTGQPPAAAVPMAMTGGGQSTNGHQQMLGMGQYQAPTQIHQMPLKRAAQPAFGFVPQPQPHQQQQQHQLQQHQLQQQPQEQQLQLQQQLQQHLLQQQQIQQQQQRQQQLQQQQQQLQQQLLQQVLQQQQLQQSQMQQPTSSNGSFQAGMYAPLDSASSQPWVSPPIEPNSYFTKTSVPSVAAGTAQVLPTPSNIPQAGALDPLPGDFLMPQDAMAAAKDEPLLNMLDVYAGPDGSRQLAAPVDIENLVKFLFEKGQEGRDIAYTFRKLNPDAVFAEGDVVGLIPRANHLYLDLYSKLIASEAVLCGVISRSAYLVANRGYAATDQESGAKGEKDASPTSSKVQLKLPSDIDLVCMYGIVNVKVKGPARRGCVIYSPPFIRPGDHDALDEGVDVDKIVDWPAGVAQVMEATEVPLPNQIPLGEAIEDGTPDANGVFFVKALISMNNNATDKAMQARLQVVQKHVKGRFDALLDRIDSNSKQIIELQHRFSQVEKTVRQLRHASEEQRRIRKQHQLADLQEGHKQLAFAIPATIPTILVRSTLPEDTSPVAIHISPPVKMEHRQCLVALKFHSTGEFLTLESDGSVRATGDFRDSASMWLLTVKSRRCNTLDLTDASGFTAPLSILVSHKARGLCVDPKTFEATTCAITSDCMPWLTLRQIPGTSHLCLEHQETGRTISFGAQGDSFPGSPIDRVSRKALLDMFITAAHYPDCSAAVYNNEQYLVQVHADVARHLSELEKDKRDYEGLPCYIISTASGNVLEPNVHFTFSATGKLEGRNLFHIVPVDDGESVLLMYRGQLLMHCLGDTSSENVLSLVDPTPANRQRATMSLSPRTGSVWTVGLSAVERVVCQTTAGEEKVKQVIRHPVCFSTTGVPMLSTGDTESNAYYVLAAPPTAPFRGQRGCRSTASSAAAPHL